MSLILKITKVLSVAQDVIGYVLELFKIIKVRNPESK